MTQGSSDATLGELAATGAFHTTRWTQVIQAKQSSGQGSDALRDLCAAYYSPVVTFLRRRGHGSDEARDLAHEFFEMVLEGGAIAGAEPLRGRFRSYLLGAVKHFLTHVREASNRQRRGGGIAPLPLDAEDECGLPLAIADDDQLPPDAAFDRQWALTTLDHALQALRRECALEGKAVLFERLQTQLTGDADHGDQVALAASLGMNPNSLKSAVLRLKRRFRALVKSQIAMTLDDEGSVEDEMASLFAALRGA